MLNDPDRLPPGRDSKLLSRQVDAGLDEALRAGLDVSPRSQSDLVKQVTQARATEETIHSPHAVSTAPANARAALGPRILVVIGFVWLALLIASFVYVSRTFGMAPGIAWSVMLALPVVALVRMVWRMVWRMVGRGPAVRVREYVFLAILVACVLSLWVFVVQGAYANGAHLIHAEDVRWSTFERRFSQDPAFRFIQIHKTERKNIHWASGTVATEADLARLKGLAVECGIEGGIDGPYAHSVSVTIAPGG